MAGFRARTGKGEKVRQERTSGRGDPAGSVNPTRSKAKRGRRAARPVPEKGRSPGRPLRWMATPAFCLPSRQGAGQNPAYRPAHRHHRNRPWRALDKVDEPAGAPTSGCTAQSGPAVRIRWCLSSSRSQAVRATFTLTPREAATFD
jgi:hypothetical protein